MLRNRGWIAGLVVAGAVVSGAATAQAQGAYNWSGLYLGGSVGGAWNDVDLTSVTAAGAATDRIPGDSFSTELDGYIAGGHVGLQHQFGNWLIGAELSLSGGDIEGSTRSTFGAADDVYRSDLSWIFLGTVRAGYTWDRWLGYIKGGYASANVRSAISDTVGGNVGEASSTERHDGWTIGGGLEYALTAGAIIGVEYNYIDLDSNNHTRTFNTGGTIIDRVDPDPIHAVTARLSFKLGRETPVAAPLK